MESDFKGIAPTHVICGECDTVTPILDVDDAAAVVCGHCETATPVRFVAILPCPEGVTTEKAAAGATCAAEDHDHDAGTHIIELG